MSQPPENPNCPHFSSHRPSWRNVTGEDIPSPPSSRNESKILTEPPLPDPKKNTLEDRVDRLLDVYDFFSSHLNDMKQTEPSYKKLFKQLDHCIESLIYAINDCQDVLDLATKEPGKTLHRRGKKAIPPSADSFWGALCWLMNVLSIFQRGARARDAVYEKKGKTLEPRELPKMKVSALLKKRLIQAQIITESIGTREVKSSEKWPVETKKTSDIKTLNNDNTQKAKNDKSALPTYLPDRTVEMTVWMAATLCSNDAGRASLSAFLQNEDIRASTAFASKQAEQDQSMEAMEKGIKERIKELEQKQKDNIEMFNELKKATRRDMHGHHPNCKRCELEAREDERRNAVSQNAKPTLG